MVAAVSEAAAYAGRAVCAVVAQIRERATVLQAEGRAGLHIGRSAVVVVVAARAIQTADGSVAFSARFATA